MNPSVTCHQVHNTKGSFAIFTLGPIDVLVPNALFDFDRSGREVEVFPLQPEHFRDAGTGSDAGFDDQAIRFFQTSQHTRGLVKGENPAFTLVSLLPKPRFAGRVALPFLPQAVALGVMVDTAHNRAYTVRALPIIRWVHSERRIIDILCQEPDL